MTKQVSRNFEGKEIIIETGKVAKQANGSATVRMGGSVVLATAVVSKEARPDIDFLPLTVEYQEKTYAAGKIPGGFFKREGRPTEKEILTARLIDRPIRPLLPSGFRNEVQIMAIVLSSDGENDPDILALIGASCALSLSEIPFDGPIGAVRVGLLDGEFVINPTYAELNKSSMDLVVVGTRDDVIMVESGSNELDEKAILDAVEFGHKKLQDIIRIQEELIKGCAKDKGAFNIKVTAEPLLADVRSLSYNRLIEIDKLSSKEEREEMMGLISKDAVASLTKDDPNLSEADIRAALVSLEKERVRDMILKKKIRPDGRGYSDIREITCEVGILPRTHGSGLFTRGQTQSLAVTTLGTSSDEQMVESLEGKFEKNFMLHYNFPPFSVGEVRPVRGPGRREIGHGALAERALKPLMPSKDTFPYTVRVVSDILESNGSSSMATVCASALSLMDAGVPIKAPVSGVAMGLVKEDKSVAILTDIAGLEDHYGDMDFKVTGTAAGITALQMDIKIKGVGLDIIRDALYQAKSARMFVLDKMLAVIAEPRRDISEYAPRITKLKIDTAKIKDVIGPGGKVIRKIIEETGVTIDIEDDGTVLVASTSEDASRRAIEKIKSLTEDVEVGKIYLGKVKRIMNFGAFCEILPGKEGLIHVSELADKFVKSVEDEVKIGDEVMVKVVEIDQQGRINLSRKQAVEKR